MYVFLFTAFVLMFPFILRARWKQRAASVVASRCWPICRVRVSNTTCRPIRRCAPAAATPCIAWTCRSAADSNCPVVLFDYQPGHGQQYSQALLSGWHDMLMIDDYSAWRTIEASRIWVAQRTHDAGSTKPTMRKRRREGWGCRRWRSSARCTVTAGSILPTSAV